MNDFFKIFLKPLVTVNVTYRNHDIITGSRVKSAFDITVPKNQADSERSSTKKQPKNI